MPVPSATDREAIPEPANRLGMAGIEFVEYATSSPQALGQELELMGFRLVARHRSREDVLYRQGEMNLVVNAQADDVQKTAAEKDRPVLSAVALRVAGAGRALGAAWVAGTVLRRAMPLPGWVRERTREPGVLQAGG